MFRLPMARISIILFIIVISKTDSLSNSLKIGINQGKSKSISLKVVKGAYEIIADEKMLLSEERESFVINLSNDGALNIVSLHEKNNKGYQKITIKPVLSHSVVKLEATRSLSGYYTGSLEFYSGRSIKIVNHIDIEKYVAGVIAAEAGLHENLEYYKLQAVICRTYALSNLDRHINEGFNLCNTVHCQVYEGYEANKMEIHKAVQATKDYVLVDKGLNIISATFHSNCGGQTVNSEDVWLLPRSYLKSVDDTFCVAQPHAKWKHQISNDEWLNYLNRKYGADVQSQNNIPIYSQNERELVYRVNNKELPLKEIRKDWNLRSTYFNIETKSDSIVLTGKGYGHGVGLCQEGAMKMAKLNYNYIKIINFYYTDVYLVSLEALRFFKEE